nr:hypothetical protein GCM10020185_08880 [Pseudomonas brassicacearum subsp. brassicacearum]
MLKRKKQSRACAKKPAEIAAGPTTLGDLLRAQMEKNRTEFCQTIEKKGDFGRPFFVPAKFQDSLQVAADDSVDSGHCETNPSTQLSLL